STSASCSGAHETDGATTGATTTPASTTTTGRLTIRRRGCRCWSGSGDRPGRDRAAAVRGRARRRRPLRRSPDALPARRCALVVEGDRACLPGPVAPRPDRRRARRRRVQRNPCRRRRARRRATATRRCDRMSHVVRTAVRRFSKSTRATRAILKELADFAHHDGVTWISQDTLVKETTYSEREVRSAIRWLESQVEIETRKAQRKRARINVYRVIVGPIGMTEPEYERLPFDLVQPFSRPADIAARREALAATPALVPDLGRLSGRPADTAARHRADDRQQDAPTTGSPTRAREDQDPSRTLHTREADASLVPPA